MRGIGANARTLRLFFALWPGDEQRARLAGLAGELARASERRMAPDNLHITLAFLGNIREDRLSCYEEAAGRVRGDAFDLTLDWLGWWARPQITWAAPRRTPPELLVLARELNTALESCGYKPEARPFRPHVTLLRQARKPPRRWDMAPIAWPVRDFVLVRSDASPDGVRYNVIKRWALEAPPGPVG